MTQENNNIILKVERLIKHFPIRTGFFQRISGWIKAVDGVDLEIKEGETLGLVGESGCGKSTLSRIILKLMEPDEGNIIYRGHNIHHLDEKGMKPLRKEMQIIFQDPFGSLNPRMTVGQSVEEGLRILGIRRSERKEQIKKLLELVGISGNNMGRYPHEFSGGQRQRIGVARALSVSPSLIICDEPVSALDVSIQAQVLNLLRDLQDRLALSYLFISHDLNVVGYMSDHIAIMYLGRIMEYSTTDKLFDNPLHPYTLALLSAIPEPRPGRGLTLKPLEGDPATPLNPPPGCRFQGRCRLVENRCREEEIPLYPADQDHLVRCWKVVGM